MASKRPTPSFLIFQDKNDHWRWNFLASNGRITVMSAESYLREQGCIKAIRMFQGDAVSPILVRRTKFEGTRPSQPAIPAAEEEPLELTEAQIVQGLD